MTHWTSRIALLAYLVGGWLLPAMHHHGGDGSHHGRPIASTCCHGGHSHHAVSSPCGPEGLCSDVESLSTCNTAYQQDSCIGCECGSPEANATLTTRCGDARYPASTTIAESSCSDSLGEHRLTNGHSSHAACVGLCALCSAQSLAAQPIGLNADASWQPTATEKVVVADMPMLLPDPKGGISSRGPPVIHS